jgi:hypothetical protein
MPRPSFLLSPEADCLLRKLILGETKVLSRMKLKPSKLYSSFLPMKQCKLPSVSGERSNEGQKPFDCRQLKDKAFRVGLPFDPLQDSQPLLVGFLIKLRYFRVRFNRFDGFQAGKRFGKVTINTGSDSGTARRALGTVGLV